MCVWDNDLWQWWITTGSDGLGAGVIGGVVTYAAVIATMRHDRRTAAEGELAAAIGRLRVAATLSTGRLHKSDDPDSDEWAEAVWQVATAALEAQALAARRHPELARDLDSFTAALIDDNDTLDWDRARIGALVGVLHTWSKSPKAYRRLDPIDWTDGPAHLVRGSGEESGPTP